MHVSLNKNNKIVSPLLPPMVIFYQFQKKDDLLIVPEETAIKRNSCFKDECEWLKSSKTPQKQMLHMPFFAR